MCGLAGIFIYRGKPVPEVNLKAMGQIMQHRGPDGEGFWESQNKCYRTIFRRLAIIDPLNSDQPILQKHGGGVLTGNGEIYNFKSLRKQFPKYAYKTNGDMETILAARDAMGDNYVDALNGMYAFAIYDRKTNSLELVRDRLGIKPLYWAEIPSGGIVFASEIKALFLSQLIKPSINENLVSTYLSHGYVPGPQTIFRNVNKLQPGHRIKISETGNITVMRYWQPKPSDDMPRNQFEKKEYLLELLDDSVRLQLQSDVQIGALLSGGIDSGLIVALASQHIPRPLKTYTVFFEGGKIDETPLAQLVANKYGCEHRTIKVNGEDAGEYLWRLTWHSEEPLYDAALLPNYLIQKTVGQDVRVSLNGTGGDELFAGYGRYFQLPIEKFYSQLPIGLKQFVIEPFFKTLSPFNAWKLQRSELFNLNRGAYIHAHSTHFPSHVRNIIGNSSPEAPAAQIAYADSFLKNFSHLGPQTAGLAADIQTYLVEDLLTLLDRTSMASSVEGRVPFLDHRFVEAALAVPDFERTPTERPKSLERSIAKTLLPKQTLSASKSGFVSPVPKWLHSSFGSAAYRLLTSKTSLERGWWTKSGIKTLINSPQEHGFRIYTLLSLELSVRMFVENTLPTAPPTETVSEVADAT